MKFIHIVSLAASWMASTVSGQLNSPSSGEAPSSSGRPLIPNTYMVQLDKSVGDVKTYLNERLRALDVDVDKIEYRADVDSELVRMASFTLPPNEANDQIVQSIGAMRFFKVGLVSRPFIQDTAITKDFDVSAYSDEKTHALTGVNDARKAFKLSGKGIKVAVIDTGVDYLHPALGGGFGPGFKVGYGYDFVGDGVTPIEDPDPMDNCSASSHGTHVAGIISGFAYNILPSAVQPPVDFSGVAPNVTIGAYRIFGCGPGPSAEDLVVKAIFKAHADGSHIINLSLGTGPQYNDDVMAYAVEQVSSQGVFVVSGIGNSQYGVASFDNPGVLLPTLYANDAPFNYIIGFRNHDFNFESSYDLIANDLNAIDRNEQNDGLFPVNPPINATGKALLIRYANNEKDSKRCDYAASVGAVACILYSDEHTGPISGNLRGSSLIPSLVTVKAAGAAIVDQLKAGKKVSLVVSKKMSTGNLPTGGTVSDFSSPGLDADLFIKPEFGAMGGNILSTISRFATGINNVPYRVMSGTSMSSPYAAGAIALLLEAKGLGKLDFKSAKTLLMNTAEPKRIFNSSMVDSVARQGAGLINIFKAITTKTLVEPPCLNLNDTKYTKQHYTITITNQNTSPVTYTIDAFGAAMATGFVPGDDVLQFREKTNFTPHYATVKFAKNNDRVDSLNVTIPAGQSKQVNVHFTPPANAIAGLFPIFSGYIQLSALDGSSKKIVASVPYAGMVGSWKDAPVWSRNSPFFTELFFKSYFPLAGNNTASTGFFADLKFNPLKTSEPFSVVNATTGGVVLPIASTTSRYGKIELIFAGSDVDKERLPSSVRHKTPLGFLSGQQFSWDDNMLDPKVQPMIFRQVSRSSPVPIWGMSRASYLIWNGKITSNVTSSEGAVAVPEGLYRVKISGLRHFGRVGATGGDPEADYDVVTSPIFKLVY
ncbi:hypothetical protein HDU97_004426 [Phlyctochytrium planicorne]|nr:hypothetical protein HDU97_004426 [Phlyctochytrium planicorne]